MEPTGVVVGSTGRIRLLEEPEEEAEERRKRTTAAALSCATVRCLMIEAAAGDFAGLPLGLPAAARRDGGSRLRDTTPPMLYGGKTSAR